MPDMMPPSNWRLMVDLIDQVVHWTLPRSFPPGEALEVDPPLPLQGSSPGSRRTGLSQQDGQDDHAQPGEDVCAGQVGVPGPDQQGAELDQGNTYQIALISKALNQVIQQVNMLGAYRHIQTMMVDVPEAQP
eukprot:10008823-Ditylum_brightwellii.AAC.1